MRQIEALIAGGQPRSAAMEAVSALTGVPARTLYNYRRLIRMVPEPDWEAALAPRWNTPKGMLAPCHPDALRLMTDLRAAGVSVAVSYRRVLAVAETRGWGTIPCERTMRRYCKAALAVGRAA